MDETSELLALVGTLPAEIFAIVAEFLPRAHLLALRAVGPRRLGAECRRAVARRIALDAAETGRVDFVGPPPGPERAAFVAWLAAEAGDLLRRAERVAECAAEFGTLWSCMRHLPEDIAGDVLSPDPAVAAGGLERIGLEVYFSHTRGSGAVLFHDPDLEGRCVRRIARARHLASTLGRWPEVTPRTDYDTVYAPSADDLRRTSKVLPDASASLRNASKTFCKPLECPDDLARSAGILGISDRVGGEYKHATNIRGMFLRRMHEPAPPLDVMQRVLHISDTYPANFALATRLMSLISGAPPEWYAQTAARAVGGASF